MSVRPLQITIEQDEEGYLFRIIKPEDNAKKKRYSLKFTFADEAGEITIPEPSRVPELCTNGRFSFSQSAKNEFFGSKTYQVFLPFKLFDWLKSGTRFSVSIELLEETGAVFAKGLLGLLINSGNRVMKYSEQAYMSYLNQIGTIDEKLAFASEYYPHVTGEHCELFTEILTKASEEDSAGLAEYYLYAVYENQSLSQYNKDIAMDWLKKSAAKHCEKALEELQKVSPQTANKMAQKKNEKLPDSLEGCLSLAETGNVEAQFKAYTRLMDTDQKQALMWLGKSVESGYEKAVDELETQYINTFLVEGNVERFIAQLEKGAGNNSLSALYKLFDIYYTGLCLGQEVKKDKRAALSYLKKAADGGLTQACYRMWEIFEDGNDLLVPAEEAVVLLTKAADQGCREAMNDLGELYVTGRIVEKDGNRGIALIQKSADLNCCDAQIRVYNMWMNGRYYDILFDIDPKRAYRLLTQYAVESENNEARIMLWETYKNGNPVLLTRQEALSYLGNAAEAGYLPAMFEMANISLDGKYKDINTQESKQLLEKGAKLGCCDAQFALFQLYYTGAYLSLTSPINKERAYKWITNAAENNSQAQYRMWEIFLSANEMGLEETEALDMLLASARKGCGDSLYATASLFAQGKYVSGNIETAIKYLSLAAEQKHPRSLFKLYEVYSTGNFDGESVEKDEKFAYRMLLLSAEFGFEPACREVISLCKSGNQIDVDNRFIQECSAYCGGFELDQELQNAHEQENVQANHEATLDKKKSMGNTNVKK